MTQGFTLSTDKAGKDQGKAAGDAVIMDASGTQFGQSHSLHNRCGEGAVQNALGTPAGQTKEGYNVWGKIIFFISLSCNYELFCFF
jgi:hypothetical protein